MTCQESPKSVLVPAACHCLCPVPSESCCSGPHLVSPGLVAQLEIPVLWPEAMTLMGQVVLTAGSLSRATWSMLMSRRPVQRARPSLVWVEWRGVSGPFSDPGGQYSHAISVVCGVVECPWAYLGSRAIESARWARALPRASWSRVRVPLLRRVTRRGGLQCEWDPLRCQAVLVAASSRGATGSGV